MRSAGRANNSKLTMDDTGLPGKPKTGTERPLSVNTPNAKGLAGFIAICIHSILAMRDNTIFTTS